MNKCRVLLSYYMQKAVAPVALLLAQMATEPQFVF